MRVSFFLGLVCVLGLLAWFVLEEPALEPDAATVVVPVRTGPPTEEQGTEPSAERRSLTVERPVPAPLPPPRRGSGEAETPQDAAVNARVQRWVKDVMQSTDPARRQATLATLRAGLASGEPDQALAALLVLARVGHIPFDREGHRGLVLPYLQASEAALRQAAVATLFHAAPEPGDVQLLCELGKDPAPEVRAALPPTLFLYQKGDFSTGPSAAVVRDLLDDEAEEVVTRTVHSLWGAKVSPEIEEQLVAMLEDPGRRADVLHYTISTLEGKSWRVLDILANAMGDPDPGIASRARWGLGRGVPQREHSRVADLFLECLRVSQDPSVQRDCLHHLGRYATPAHVHDLRRWTTDPRVEEPVRRQAQRLIERLEQE